MEKKDLLSEYELDSMWMSYRYCIGRSTIAAHHRAGDIAKHCYGRMSDERSIFTAYDINKEIENAMMFRCGANFHFPATSFNRIYTSAIDIFCQFIEEFNITDKKQLLNYKDVYIKLYDNERGYTFETVTWKEWETAEFRRLCEKHKINPDDIQNLPHSFKEYEGFKEFYEKLEKHNDSYDYFYFSGIEDLFVWNDLLHLFDKEHHHKSILTNGLEIEWFWTYDNDVIDNGDGTFRKKDIGYRRIRVPVDKWDGVVTRYIPDELIKEDLY